MAQKLVEALLDSAPTDIFIVQDGKFQFVNPWMQRQSGYSEDELLGIDALSLIHPEDRDMVREAVVKMLKGERSAPYEYRAVHKSGEVRWIVTAVAPILYRGRRAALGNSVDITERKQAEELFKTLTLSASINIFIIQDGKLQFVNPAMQGQTGYSEEELLGSEALSYVHPQDRGLVREAVAKKLKGESSLPHEYRIIKKGGEARWVMATVAPILYRGRRAALGNSVDFTERKQAEELFRTLTLSAPTDIFIVQDGKYRFVNPWMPQHTGYSEDELLSMEALSTVHPEDRDMVRENVERMLKGERPYLFEHRGVKKDGQIWWVMTTAVPIHYRGRRAILVNCLDITERKQMEEALRQSELKLRDLAEAAVQAHEEERQWIAYEVHDRIAQGLASVLQQLEVLKRLTRRNSGASQAAARTSALLHEAIGEARGIMDEVYPPGLAEFGLIPLIEEELHPLEEAGCGVKLEADCPGRLPPHVEVTLYRILHEALLNVRRHAPGAKNVAVSLAYRGQSADLQVQDDGPGFDVEAALQGKRVGGLASMGRRAEILGGTFQVMSSPGQGTRVAVRVPVGDGDR